MSKPNDGGPAFPCAVNVQASDSGMTLRDYFAAKAIPACINYAYSEKHYDPVLIAEQAYELADAMLAARKLSPLAEDGSSPSRSPTATSAQSPEGSEKQTES